MSGLFEYVLAKYRWIFVIFLLIPLTVTFEVLYIISSVLFKKKKIPEKHDVKVAKVQKQVNKWRNSSRYVPMCTGRAGWKTVSLREGLYKHSMFKVEINMSDILELDTVHRTVKVEPLVNMGQISSYLIPRGWTLPVLPELDTLTVGGLIMGCGIETSSHIYGLFQHICVRFEVVLADGTLVSCSKDENTDLFNAIPWSHGTLGFLCSAELRVIPAKKYVKIKYTPAYTLDEMLDMFSKEVSKDQPSEFVEGILFSSESGVVMNGEFCDEAEHRKINNINRFYKPLFYEYVKNQLWDGPSFEYIPLKQYYHRHTRSFFWEIKYIIPFANNPIFRLLLGWILPLKMSLLKFTTIQKIKDLYEKHHLLQDFLVPLKKLKEALLFIDDQAKVYPLWLCAFKLPNSPGFVHPNGGDKEIYVDIGLYGEPTSENYQFPATVKHMESYLRINHGFQMLYADSYMTKEEFREMFDHTLYDKMRKQLDGCEEAFPDVYDKVSRSARY